MTGEGRGFRVLENEWIALGDGTRLAARIWMPEGAEADPVPAVLEFLPYRKRDGTSARDESTYPTFARAGYAGVRVDIRGSGESEGVIDGEYTPRELSDACEVVAWIAAQPWCSGSVGMMGISWGGFNALQVAALGPPALKAVISIASTVDRYADDIHWKGGCQLGAQLSWAATMLAYQSRPPDPALVGDRWRAMWMERLAGEPFMLEEWLAHPRRDAFWRHGSICEDFAAVQVPGLVIAGWADGYRNTPLKAVEGLGDRAKAIIGPWVHKYPHFANPHPRMDFLGEAVRWWDHWLKGVPNGAEALPQVRAYLLDGPRPARRREADPGRWVAVDRWSQPKPMILRAGPDRSLRPESEQCAPLDRGTPAWGQTLHLKSPADTGVMAGEFFTLKPDAEMAGDQRADDAGSLCYETEPLAEAIELLGQPEVHLTLALRAATGHLAARLVDVHPDGTATRISFGVQNLAHLGGDSDPRPSGPGRRLAVPIALDACGYRLGEGHRLRLSLSTAYWPMILPAPENAGVDVDVGSITMILPLLVDSRDADVPAPADPDLLPRYREHASAASRRAVERDLQAGVTRYVTHEDTGLFEHPETGLATRQVRDETWAIAPDDPLSMTGICAWTTEMRRGGWSVRTESIARLAATATEWVTSAEVVAFEGDEEVHRKAWSRRIPRDLS